VNIPTAKQLSFIRNWVRIDKAEKDIKRILLDKGFFKRVVFSASYDALSIGQ